MLKFVTSVGTKKFAKYSIVSAFISYPSTVEKSDARSCVYLYDMNYS